MDRQQKRLDLLDKRNQLPEILRSKASEVISGRVLSTLSPTDKVIGVYLSTGSEVDLKKLIIKLWASKRTIYVPKIISKYAMQWHLFTSWDDCVTERFGIETSKLPDQIDISQLDVILMPCVGFDRQFNRLGMGGGYYDRALENHVRKPRRLGIAFSVQESPGIECEPWDIPFHSIVTESEIIQPQ